ncbi:hypothetical protein CMI37_35310 [Candidatus Pacearchaeota archaeon]|nr:hypothetical protein [Candidatus Pacearchaeota archaeon]
MLVALIIVSLLSYITTESFKYWFMFCMLSPLFPQERATEHTFFRFVTSLRVIFNMAKKITTYVQRSQKVPNVMSFLEYKDRIDPKKIAVADSAQLYANHRGAMHNGVPVFPGSVMEAERVNVTAEANRLGLDLFAEELFKKIDAEFEQKAKAQMAREQGK